MTQLIIAGVETVLPQQFSVAVKRENPFFTKSGEYTYDCTLRLDNPVNQHLYAFLHRLNRAPSAPAGFAGGSASVSSVSSSAASAPAGFAGGSVSLATRRTALLIADGHVYCRGTEVITKWTDQTVSIQIVSGESELNFFVGQDQKIETLDLGELTRHTYDHTDSRTGTTTTYTLYDSDGTYPQADYCRVPVRTRGGGILNLNDPWTIPGSPHCPQPYLCMVVRRILTALGYTIGTDQLSQTQFRNLFLVNTVITPYPARMLAGWTVKDFLTEVERLTGVVFVTDNSDPTSLRVDILLKTTYYQDARQLPLSDVIDSYEMEVNDDNGDPEFTASSVSYQVADGFWRNLLKLPEDFLDSATVESYADIDSILILGGDNVCRDVSTGRLYIKVEREPDPWDVGGQGETYWQELDQYGDLKREGSTSELELKLTPAPMGYVGYSGVEIIDLGTTDGWHDVISGTVDEGEEEEGQDDGSSLFDNIRNFSKEESAAADICCAFFTGTTVTMTGNRTYPLAFTDAYHASVQAKLHPESEAVFSIGGIEGSLRLQDLDADYYQGGYQIDTAHAVTFQTFDPNHIDVRQVYVIGNRRYVVRDVEETVTAEGRSPLWKLTCYPIDISDEAAENRWILTRGVWDDGGAWLDDGRWNDGSNE